MRGPERSDNRRGEPPGGNGRLLYLEQTTDRIEALLRSGSGIACSLCGRRADRFRLDADFAVLCVECATGQQGEWHTLDRVLGDFLAALILMLNAKVALLGLQTLARAAPEVAALCAELPALDEGIAGECLRLLALVGRLRRTAADCGLSLPDEGFFHPLLRGWKP